MNVAVNKNVDVTKSFKEFQSLVNFHVYKRAGIGLFDLADFDLWNYFENGMTMTENEWKQLAIEAADDALADNHFPF